ncbi:MAG TPA: dihydrodipicolinate synthase family protein [Ruminiclostridium sp.]
MNNKFPGGVWPTMITPYKVDGSIDYDTLEKMIEWYIKNQVQGLFAVCQSSEMFYLTLEERVELASFVKNKANGRVPVIASGHISDSIEDQVIELNKIAKTGVDAVILITNRLAKENEPDSVFIKNLERIMSEIPKEMPLGFYECPYPYKRLVSPEIIKYCLQTGRFYFIKDTSCDVDNIRKKMELIKGTQLKLYNANAATLLETLPLGVEGYCGVMANFHPALYSWLLENWKKEPQKSKELMNFLSLASQIERQLYPVNAKYHFGLEGIEIQCSSRSKDASLFTASNKLEVEHLHGIAKTIKTLMGI